jgi:hypothetical protein
MGKMATMNQTGTMAQLAPKYYERNTTHAVRSYVERNTLGGKRYAQNSKK